MGKMLLCQSYQAEVYTLGNKRHVNDCLNFDLSLIKPMDEQRLRDPNRSHN